MNEAIFPHFTKEVVRKLGTSSNLISNNALNKKWEMLTLFKIEKKSWFSYYHPRPKPFTMTLNKITDERICLKSDREVLVKDFQNFKLDNFSVEAGGEAVGGQAEASGKNEQSASPVTLMTETIRQDDLSDLIMRANKIKLNTWAKDNLKLQQGEKLAFVSEIVYNTTDVKVKSETSTNLSFKAKIYSFIPGCSQGERTEVTTLTVPENNIFAFALEEITLEDGYLRISPEQIECKLLMHEITIKDLPGYPSDASKDVSTKPKMMRMHLPEEANILGRMMVNNIKTEAKVLEALADVPGSTRMDLLKKLWSLWMDSEPLAVLDDSLYEYRHGKHQHPQSEAVASFMDILDASKASSNFTKALHVLVCALQELPDNTAALLAKSGSETLNCIIQMIDGLEDGQAKLPESPPLPLQEKGELHWVAKFLIAANDLEGLKKNWDETEISPEGLVELLYTSVDGLSRMQAGVSS